MPKTRKVMLFPFDLIAKIVKYIPFADVPKSVVAMHPGVDTVAIKKITNEIQNPEIFFEDFVKQIPGFITAMRATDTCLVGLRAFSFFHNMVLPTTYTWRFMCCNDIVMYLMFIDHLMKGGVEWEMIRPHPQYNDTYRSPTYIIEGNLMSNGKRVHISIESAADWDSVFEIAVDYGATPMHCIVTGYEAFDPYGKLHAQGKFRLWKNPRRSHEYGPRIWRRDITTQFDMLNYCREMSMIPVSYETHRDYDPYTMMEVKERFFGDDECLIVKFGVERVIPECPGASNITKVRWLEEAYSIHVSAHSLEYVVWNPLMLRYMKSSMINDLYEYDMGRDGLLPPLWANTQIWNELVLETRATVKYLRSILQV